MPRNIDPSNIRTGTGAAADESVDNNALIQPTQGTDALRVHLLDPVDAHDASAIYVEDTGGNFTSDEVEGALAELSGISTTVNQSRQLGWFTGGVVDFASAVTDAGLTITLDDNGGANPWAAIISTGVVDVSGDSIALPDNSTVWVYVDSTTGVLTSTGAAPDISNDEDVIVGRFTTLAGSVTVKEDGRFFIMNDNRKIEYSVRADGTNIADIHSEGAFASLEAAFLWLDTYSGSGTTVSEKTRIVVRGEHTISSTLTVPVDNLVLEGEGDAIIATGASVDPLIELDGHDGVEIRRLTFTCNHANSVVVASDGGSVTGLVIEDCIATSLGSSWLRFADFDANALLRSRFENLQVLVGGANCRGIRVDEPSGVAVRDSFFTATGVSGIPRGVVLGSPGGNPNQEGVVEGCRFTDFEESVRVLGDNHRVIGCHIMRDALGVGIIVGSGSTNCVVRDNVVTPSADIDVGISINATAGTPTSAITVTGNKLYALNTYGILLTGPVEDAVVRDNLVDAVIGAQEPTAEGIRVAVSGERPENITIENNTVKRCAEGIVVRGARSTRATATITVASVGDVSAGDTITIGGVTLTAVTGARTPGSDDFDETIGVDTAMATEIAAAINDPDNSFRSDLVRAEASGADVILYHVIPGTVGNGTTLATSDATAFTLSAATLTGGQDLILKGMSVVGNTVENCAFSQSGAGADSFEGAGCKGIGLEWTFEAKVLDNTIAETGIQRTAADVVSFPSSTGADVESQGIYLRNCSNSIIRGNSITNTVATGATTATGIDIDLRSTGEDPTFTVTSVFNVIDSNTISAVLEGAVVTIGASPTQYGIRIQGDLGSDDATVSQFLSGYHIKDNKIASMGVDGINVTLGNRVSASAWQVQGNTVTGTNQHGMYFLIEDPGAGTTGTSSLSQFQVSGNSVSLAEGSGILFEGTRAVGTNRMSNIDVYDNQLGFISEHGIRITAVSGFTVVSNRVSRNILRSTGTDGSTHYAISLEVADGGSGQQDRWTVNDNEIIDHLDSGEFAIYLAVTDENLTEWDVSGNRISGGGSTSSDGGGIRVQTAQAGGSAGIRQGKCLGNTILSILDGIRVEARYEVDNLQIANNTILINGAGGGTVATSARPVWVRAGLDLGGTGAQNILITDNVFDGGDGSRIGVGNDVRVDNVVFSNNTINTTDQTNDPASDGYPRGGYAAFSFNQQSVLVGTAVSNLVVEGNTIRDVQREAIHVSQTLGGLSRLIEGLHIKNNSIYNAGIANDQRGILTVYADNLAGTDGVRNLQITGNSFESINFTNNLGSPCLTGLIYVEAAPDSFRISGNTFAECTATGNSTAQHNLVGAVTIYTTATNDIRNGEISNNTFRNVDLSADSGTSTNSVAVGLVAVWANSQNVVNVQVSNNSAHGCGITSDTDNASAVARGGLVTFLYSTIKGLHISDNNFVFCSSAVTAGSGGTEYCGTFNFSGSTTRELSVVDNTMRDVDPSTGGGPAAVMRTQETMDTVRFNGNVITQTTGYVWYHDGSATGEPVNQLECSDNHATRGDLAGEFFNFNTTGDTVGVRVCRNRVVGYEALLDLTGVTEGDRLEYVFVEDNYLNFASATGIQFGIDIFAAAGDGDFYGDWSINRNWLNGVNATYGIRASVASINIGDEFTFGDVMVNNNHVSMTATGDQGIRVSSSRGNLRNVSVCHNHVFGGDGSNAHGIDIDINPGSNASDVDLEGERIIVDSNVIENWGEGSNASLSGRYWAIRLWGDTSGGNDVTLRDCSASGNMCEGTRDTQGGIALKSNGGPRGCMFLGNTIRFPSGTTAQTGFGVDASAAGKGCHYANNHVQQANTVHVSSGSGFTNSICANNTGLNNSTDDWTTTGSPFDATFGASTTTGNLDA